ncbi:MAG: pyridoxamine 5'-phosphate oxidase family protein [Parasphingorhabdus sp.]|uniref:pyridoxamine 5'-phosphate oxidase family protein n=1 Tax=Parasphingorhabdus sp. TaxID=2709688 RepID=UPI0032990959
MNTEEKHLFLDDLSASFEESWKLLFDAANNRKSPMHTLAVATISQDGGPSQRIMVLRDTNKNSRALRFHTDSRALKTSEVAQQNLASILAYHSDAKVQLRLKGTARIETDTEDCEAAWQEASLYGKRCYLADPAPGTEVDHPTSGLDPDMEGRKPDIDDVIPARENFAIMLIEVEHIEWLYLAHTGHRRALFSWDANQKLWDKKWLVP